MAKYSRKGAGNMLRIFELLDPVAAGDPYTLDAANPEIEFDQTFASAFTRQDSGSYEISLDQDMVKKAYWDFLDEFALPGGTSTDDEFYEDGTVAEKVTTTTGGTVKYVGVVWHGEVHPTDGRRCFIAVGTISTSSGSFTTNNTDRTKPTLVFTSISSKSDVEFPATAFEATLVTGAAQTLEKDKYGKYVFLPVP